MTDPQTREDIELDINPSPMKQMRDQMQREEGQRQQREKQREEEEKQRREKELLRYYERTYTNAKTTPFRPRGGYATLAHEADETPPPDDDSGDEEEVVYSLRF